jgi:hypothetical protein
MARYSLTVGSTTVVVEYDGSQASAPIVVDGVSTQYQTADARHHTDAAMRLAASVAFGAVYETVADALADGRRPGVDSIVIWDDVEYLEQR